MIYHLQHHLLLLLCIKTNDLQKLNCKDINLIGENGIINQTLFKTNEKYDFDSNFHNVLTLVKGYMNYIQPRLDPASNYFLVSQNGKQISKLNNIFSSIVLGNCKRYQLYLLLPNYRDRKY